jgi:hypothetical protein
LLRSAIGAGLAPAELLEARFALGYIRARLERPGDARTVLTEIPEDEWDGATVQLLLWCHVKLKEYAPVLQLWEKHANRVQGSLEAKRLAGIAYLEEGLRLWEAEKIKDAVDAFAKLRKLGVEGLDQHIPQHIDQHQIVAGVRALMNCDYDSARSHFGSAQQSNADEAGRRAAQVGLLLCEFREHDAPDIDQELGELTDWWERNASISAAPSAGQMSEKARMAGSLALWHAVSFLFRLLQIRASKSGLLDEDRETLFSRLARAELLDAEAGEARLIRGLINYFFAKTPDARAAAVAEMEQAFARGAQSVPEVEELTRKEKRLTRSLEQGLLSFLRLGRKYLADEHVQASKRAALRHYLARFAEYESVQPIDEVQESQASSPSLSQLNTRVTDLRGKIARVLRPGVTASRAEVAHVQALLERLDGATKALLENAESVEDAEYDVMVGTGEYFLSEEQRADGRQGAA